jgi:hypothetical protein
MANVAGAVEIVMKINAANYSAGMQKIKGQLKQFEQSSKSAQGATEGLSHHAGNLRRQFGLLDNAIRGAHSYAMIDLIRGFEKTKLVMTALPIAATIAGIAVIGGVVVDVVEKIKKWEDASRELRAGFQSLTVAQQSSNDALAITNDKLEIQIAKLEHRPANGLKLTLDEARSAADDLAKSLQSDMNKMDSLLSANGISAIGAFLTRQGGTGFISDKITEKERDFADLGFRYQQAVRRGDAALAEKLKTDLDEARIKAQDWAKSQIEDRRTGKHTVGNQAANITILEGFIQNISDTEDRERLIAQNKQLQARKAKDEALAANEEALRKFTESLKTAADVIERNRANRAEASRQGLIMPKAMVGAYGQPTDNLQSIPPLSDLSRNSEAIRRAVEQSGFQVQRLTAANEYKIITQQTGDAMAEAALKMQVLTGTITAHDAALQLAAIHTQEYTERIGDLFSQLDTLKELRESGAISSSEYGAKAQAVENQMSVLNGQRRMQIAEDQLNSYQTTVAGAAREALNRMVQSWTDMTAQIADLLPRSIDAVDQSLSQSLMAHAYNGREYRRNIEQGLSSTARGIGSQVLNAGLQHIEGGILSKFGFGPQNKPKGTANDPIYTKDADAAQKAAGNIVSKLFGGNKNSGDSNGGGFGGFLSSIFGGGSSDSDSSGGGGGGLFSGFFADGGPIPSNLPAIVGERGPELFVPSTAGHIIPNDRLGFGDTHVHHTVNVDARGAQDPAAVEAAVHRAMGEWAPKVMAGAVQAVQERRLRQPSTVR